MSRVPEIEQVVDPEQIVWFEYLLDASRLPRALDRIRSGSLAKRVAADLIHEFLSHAVDNKQLPTLDGPVYLADERASALFALVSRVIRELQLPLQFLEERVHRPLLPKALACMGDEGEPSWLSASLYLQRLRVRDACGSYSGVRFSSAGGDLTPPGTPQLPSSLTSSVDNTESPAEVVAESPAETLEAAVAWLATWKAETRETGAQAMQCQVAFELGTLLFMQEDREAALGHFATARRLLAADPSLAESEHCLADMQRLTSFMLVCSKEGSSLPAEGDGQLSVVAAVEAARAAGDFRRVAQLIAEDVVAACAGRGPHLSVTLRGSLESPESYGDSSLRLVRLANQLHDFVLEGRTDGAVALAVEDVEAAVRMATAVHKAVGEGQQLLVAEWIRRLVVASRTPGVWKALLASSFAQQGDEKRLRRLEAAVERKRTHKQMNVGAHEPRAITWLADGIRRQQAKADGPAWKRRAISLQVGGQVGVASLMYEAMGPQDVFGSLTCAALASGTVDAQRVAGLCSQALPALEHLEAILAILINSSQHAHIVALGAVLDENKLALQPPHYRALVDSARKLAAFLLACDALETESSNQALVAQACATALAFLQCFRLSSMTCRWHADEGFLGLVTNERVVALVTVAMGVLVRTHVLKYGEEHAEHLQLCLAAEHYEGHTVLSVPALHASFAAVWAVANEQQSSQFASSFAGLRRAFFHTAKRQADLRPSSAALLQLGDAYFEESRLQAALCTYFRAGALRTSCFADTQPEFSYATTTLYRIVHALFSTGAVTQAAAVVQYLEAKTSQMGVLFRMVQASASCLDASYFPYIWDVSLLELFVAVFSRMGEEQMATKLARQLGKPQLNVNNDAEQLASLRSSLKQELFSAIYAEMVPCSI